MTHAGSVTRADEPILVTTAPQSPRDEQRARTRRYLFTMGLRVVCFVLAIVLVALDVQWEFAALAVVGSLVLPWVAVIAANSGPARRSESPSLYRERRRELD
jgi:hypothetical protein